jgi:GntR family transcriptional regulator
VAPGQAARCGFGRVEWRGQVGAGAQPCQGPDQLGARQVAAEGTPIMLPEAGPYAGAGVRDRMELIGLKPTHCTEENMARPLTRAEADRLGLTAGLPVLVVERTYFRGEQRLETANIVFPPYIHAVYEIPVD